MASVRFGFFEFAIFCRRASSAASGVSSGGEGPEGPFLEYRTTVPLGAGSIGNNCELPDRDCDEVSPTGVERAVAASIAGARAIGTSEPAREPA
jgi:hypothetical protein